MCVGGWVGGGVVGGERRWGVVDHESDQSYHGLITLSQRRDHKKRSDYAPVRKCDFRSLRSLEYCYWVFLISLILNLLG